MWDIATAGSYVYVKLHRQYLIYLGPYEYRNLRM
jgi:hypothetical protein